MTMRIPLCDTRGGKGKRRGKIFIGFFHDAGIFLLEPLVVYRQSFLVVGHELVRGWERRRL